MKQFKILDKQYSIATDWSDLTLNQYMELCRTISKQDEYSIPTLYMLSIFEVLCNVNSGDLDDMDLETLGEMTQDMGFITSAPKYNKVDHLNIEGVDYTFGDFTKLNLKEVITIQLLQKQYTNQFDFIPRLIGVLLRPSKKILDSESKKEYWVQEKFDDKNFEYRVDLFLSKCKGIDLMGAADFFLIGNKPLTKTLKGSMKKGDSIRGSKLALKK